ncbi:MAG TPA: hypothetical protein VE732_07090 [Nitrososphaera sp.]|nr:hypothetical protein [Nitrososphaera sp.]
MKKTIGLKKGSDRKHAHLLFLGPHIRKVHDAPKPLTDQTTDEQQYLFEQYKAGLELLAAKAKRKGYSEFGTQP